LCYFCPASAQPYVGAEYSALRFLLKWSSYLGAWKTPTMFSENTKKNTEKKVTEDKVEKCLHYEPLVVELFGFIKVPGMYINRPGLNVGQEESY